VEEQQVSEWGQEREWEGTIGKKGSGVKDRKGKANAIWQGGKGGPARTGRRGMGERRFQSCVNVRGRHRAAFVPIEERCYTAREVRGGRRMGVVGQPVSVVKQKRM
jgi:hypothetical protein